MYKQTIKYIDLMDEQIDNGKLTIARENVIFQRNSNVGG
jgi:hypothetical protein